MFVDLLIDCSTSGERYFGSIHDRQILQTIESLIICTWVKRIDKLSLNVSMVLVPSCDARSRYNGGSSLLLLVLSGVMLWVISSYANLCQTWCPYQRLPVSCNSSMTGVISRRNIPTHSGMPECYRSNQKPKIEVQTRIYKTLHKEHTIEQHEPHSNTEVHSGIPEWVGIFLLLMTPVMLLLHDRGKSLFVLRF
jgi:hypothetical protein